MEGLAGEVLQTPSAREGSATDKVRGKSSKCITLYLYAYTYIHTCIVMHVHVYTYIHDTCCTLAKD